MIGSGYAGLLVSQSDHGLIIEGQVEEIKVTGKLNFSSSEYPSSLCLNASAL